MQTSYDKENVVYAGFFSRLAAFVLDCILVGVGLWIIKIPVWFVKLSAGDSALFSPILFKYNVFDVIYYLLTVTYFVLMTYFCGATVGKSLLKLKVVDVEGQKLGFMTVLIRETVGKYLSALIIYIGYIIAGVDNRKQGLHDKIADTCVIYHQKKVEKRAQSIAPIQPMQQKQDVVTVDLSQQIQPVEETSIPQGTQSIEEVSILQGAQSVGQVSAPQELQSKQQEVFPREVSSIEE